MPVTKECDHCGGDVTRAPSLFTGDTVFCDKKCHGKYMESKVSIECENCGNTDEKHPSKINEDGYNFCDLDCYREYNTKENHPNWTGGSDRFSKTLEGRQWRKSVFERDDYTCQDCGERGGVLNAHHIKQKSEYPELKDVVSNGTTLCEGCHAERHSGEKAYHLIKGNMESR